LRFPGWTIVLAAGTFLVLALSGLAQDTAFRVHMGALTVVLALATISVMRLKPLPADGATIAESSGYFDAPIRIGSILTLFWGIVGFLVGVLVASQLAWPELNLQPWLNFGRLRPLHTSAVIFAFGGTALITTSLYVVQRTSRARLISESLAWFVFWGYQLFIVMAATGYLLGITESREYAEPEWYVDSG
jgi:cytochrome c oxidase cbb3-type subunit I